MAKVNVLDSFSDLKEANVSVRIKSSLIILEYVLCCQNEGKHKEIHDVLKRLVRGLGSSRLASKKGYFATLIGFFYLPQHQITFASYKDIVSTVLTIGKGTSKKETGDVIMGEVLAYGVLIHSGFLKKSSNVDQTFVVKTIIEASKKRSYLLSPAYTFLVSFMRQVDEPTFTDVIWPTVADEVSGHGERQSLETIYVLLTTQQLFPNVVKGKFLKATLKAPRVLHEATVHNIVHALMTVKLSTVKCHPVYETVARVLATSEQDVLLMFWGGIDSKLTNPTKNQAQVAFKIFSLLLNHMTDISRIPALLTPNFVRMMMDCKNSHSGLNCRQALDLLVSSVGPAKCKTSISVISKLMLNPGRLGFDKLTCTRTVQALTNNLKPKAVQGLSMLYRSVITGESPKVTWVMGQYEETTWTNKERVCVIHLFTRLLGHNMSYKEVGWRTEQLKFLLELGVFNSGAQKTFLPVGSDLAEIVKDSFFGALSHRFPHLSDLSSTLSCLVHHADSLFKNGAETRSKMSHKAKVAWSEMLKMVEVLEMKDREGIKSDWSRIIFHIMFLFMGLMLLKEHNTAQNALKELSSVYERISAGKTSNDEPHWTEVVIDLFLSILSRSNQVYRHLVQCVFKHICPHLTHQAIHQVIEILDPRKEKNLLSKGGFSEGSEDDDEEEVDTSEVNGAGGGHDIENDSLSDDDSDIYSDEEKPEGTAIDNLRCAVRQALGSADTFTDTESVDIDDMDEEEGKRVDIALSHAFRGVIRSNPKRQSHEQIALTHFRTRAIDLLDTFVGCSPPLCLALDLIPASLTLLSYCVPDPRQTPLAARVRSLISKLTALKQFSNLNGVEEGQLVDVLNFVINNESHSAPIVLALSDQITQCCTFIVRCSQLIACDASIINDILKAAMDNFALKSACVLPAQLFHSVLRLPRDANLAFGPHIANLAFNPQVRPYLQALSLDLLTTLFNNARLDTKHIEHKETMSLVGTTITAGAVQILKCSTPFSSSIVLKLFRLLVVLRQRAVTDAMDWQQIELNVIQFRAQNFNRRSSDCKKSCNRLCSLLGISRSKLSVET